jgi:hypothetical protein
MAHLAPEKPKSVGKHLKRMTAPAQMGFAAMYLFDGGYKNY